jgi:hypothetical protein
MTLMQYAIELVIIYKMKKKYKQKIVFVLKQIKY